MTKGLPRTVKPSRHQTGRSVSRKDRPRNAMMPGKRISKSGKVYWENRKNRSDRRGKRV